MKNNLKTKSLLGVKLFLIASLLTTSCSEDNNALDEDENTEITDSDTDNMEPVTGLSAESPFGFSDLFEGDDFQVDNDGDGAHNWNIDEYEDNTVNNGFNIRDFIFVSENMLILECPNGEDDERRRAEYRDQENINLNDPHSMNFTFTINNYNNDSELIMAQMHNDDDDVNRPYITILTENGEIRMQRTNAPTGSSTERSPNTMAFIIDDTYTITISTDSGDNSIFTKIVNKTANEQIEQTFVFNDNVEEEWGPHNGEFYWKFGAYMPDGGSTNTQMQMEEITIQGQ